MASQRYRKGRGGRPAEAEAGLSWGCLLWSPQDPCAWALSPNLSGFRHGVTQACLLQPSRGGWATGRAREETQHGAGLLPSMREGRRRDRKERGARGREEEEGRPHSGWGAAAQTKDRTRTAWCRARPQCSPCPLLIPAHQRDKPGRACVAEQALGKQLVRPHVGCP